jgi:hypothetical protein
MNSTADEIPAASGILTVNGAQAPWSVEDVVAKIPGGTPEARAFKDHET